MQQTAEVRQMLKNLHTERHYYCGLPTRKSLISYIFYYSILLFGS